jgi:hypothetical protein
MTPVAGVRDGAFLSESAVQRLLEDWEGGDAPLDLRRAVAQGAVAAERQAAVVRGIAELTAKHSVLKEPGRTMLRGLSYLDADTVPAEVRGCVPGSAQARRTRLMEALITPAVDKAWTRRRE